MTLILDVLVAYNLVVSCTDDSQHSQGPEQDLISLQNLSRPQIQDNRDERPTSTSKKDPRIPPSSASDTDSVPDKKGKKKSGFRHLAQNIFPGGKKDDYSREGKDKDGVEDGNAQTHTQESRSEK